MTVSDPLDLIWNAMPLIPASLWVMLGVAVLLRLLMELLKSAKGKGMLGERAVRRGLTLNLDTKVYHILADILIPDGKGGTAQIDHVVLSPFGLFVIETKNYDGWIFGQEKDREWTVSYRGGRKHRFLNPLLQNQGHIMALEKLLGVSRNQCHNVVAFTGAAVFKTGAIPGVIQKGLAAHIQSHRQPMFDAAAVATFAEYLRGTSLSGDRTARAAHVEYARSRQRKPQA